MSNLAFSTFNDFLHMDGHGVYVWPVYIISTFIILLAFLTIYRNIQLLRKKIKAIRYGKLNYHD